MFLPRTVFFFFSHVYFFLSACGLVDTMAPSFYFKDSAIVNFMEKTLSSLRRKTEFFKHEKGKSKPSSLHPLLYSRLSVPVGRGDTRSWDGD